jgi:cobalt-zinc-cadmium efflux system membrane fusion protein
MRRRITIAFVLSSIAVGAIYLNPSVVSRIGTLAGPVTKDRTDEESSRRETVGTRVELVPGEIDTLRLPPDVAEALGIHSTPSRKPERSRTLVLAGSLALDANRLARVHPRFAGEVAEIGTVPDDTRRGADGRSAGRPLRFGDEVREGQLLAVLWSTALGEKKSEYVDALSQLRLERETLRRQEALLKDQAIPERNVREAMRAVEAAEIAVNRVERTLRSWRLTDAEVEDIRAEAEQIRTHKGTRDGVRERSWARLEVRAPFGGTLVEKNVAVGDIVETTTDVFKIADLRRLGVQAHVYEEDLPFLLAIPAPIRWTIRVKSDPGVGPLEVTIEEIGDIIDPSQHTALVVGHVDNPQGRMRAGQFITATVELPPDPGEVEIPTSAVVEDGEESVVFVQPDPQQPRYALRRVSIIRHSQEVAYVRSVPGLQGTRDAAGRGDRASEPKAIEPGRLQPGEHVVTSGALLLRAALKDLTAASREVK